MTRANELSMSMNFACQIDSTGNKCDLIGMSQVKSKDKSEIFPIIWDDSHSYFIIYRGDKTKNSSLK